MKYTSTRNPGLSVEAGEAITRGISADGGLFVPESFPGISGKLQEYAKLGYRELCKEILSLYLTDFTQQEIDACVENAYGGGKFHTPEPVALTPLDEKIYMLELWHGPTCAFKDMALQLLPQLLSISLKKYAPGKTAAVLVATSGDTGKAALEGFRDVPNTEMIVFYPKDGVSPMQKLQMQTQEGKNLCVCAVEGNFDDAQTAVKKIFTDEAVKARLDEKEMFFSSANSINLGRLLPQIIYYIFSYLQLCISGAVKPEDRINVAVPTGNFGNILAAYYAYRMGLPVNRFICASNRNKILTDFINTGVYDRRRDFHTTISPSMDILISSNLERLLYALCGNAGTLRKWMEELSKEGFYEVDEHTAREIRRLFSAGFCSDDETRETIGDAFEDENYLVDTHTAVALNVLRKYREESGDLTPAVVASTANPYKFPGSVLSAFRSGVSGSEFDNLKELETLTGTEAPVEIKQLEGKAPRFSFCMAKDGLSDFVVERLEKAGE